MFKLISRISWSEDDELPMQILQDNYIIYSLHASYIIVWKPCEYIYGQGNLAKNTTHNNVSNYFTIQFQGK